MKRILIIAIVVLNCLMLVQAALLRAERAERKRIQANNRVLTDSVEFYRTKSGKHAASRQVFELRASELERYNAQLAAQVRELRIKARRLEAAATTATATIVELRARLRDTVIYREPKAGPIIGETVKVFRWADPWVTVEGLIDGDSVGCRVESIDTLQQIVHRVPRRFLFIRWGTKAIRQEVVSSNPHTRIVYTEYVEFTRKTR